MSFVDQYAPWAVVTGAAAGVGLGLVEELHARGLGVVMVDIDALHLGGRWRADEGLEFAAAVERRERVDMISEANVAMYPKLFER